MYMEQVIEKIDDKKTEFKVVKKKKSFKILGISIWRIFAYFVVYSVIGYAIETLFGIARYGMLESRKRINRIIATKMGKNLHSFLPIRYPRYAIRILTY